MIVVTGGAGFIGSATVWALNQRGRTDVVIVDNVDHEEKEHNVGHLRYDQIVGIVDFRKQLLAGEFDPPTGGQNVEAIIHLGACSSTMEKNWEYLLDTNVKYTKDIIRWCADHSIRCVYASSAATYGNGEHGYDDDHALFNQLTPLNLYGKSKLLVDIWARDGGYLHRAVGLRYFNVFGPNEWHKGSMKSVIATKYPDVAANKPITLFKSYKDGYADGEQQRDFIYVKDAVRATLFFLDNPEHSGVFNVGMGNTKTWIDVARAIFTAAGKDENIEFVPMPEQLQSQYQYFTQANIKKLIGAGFDISQNYSLESAITEYVQKHLAPHKHLGETA